MLVGLLVMFSYAPLAFIYADTTATAHYPEEEFNVYVRAVGTIVGCMIALALQYAAR